MRVERKAVSARPAGVRYVTVGAESAGQRLDNFLIRLSKGVPKSHIYQVVRSGQVRINSGRAAADRRLSAGDQIRIPPMRISGRTGALPPAAAKHASTTRTQVAVIQIAVWVPCARRTSLFSVPASA